MCPTGTFVTISSLVTRTTSLLLCIGSNLEVGSEAKISQLAAAESLNQSPPQFCDATDDPVGFVARRREGGREAATQSCSSFVTKLRLDPGGHRQLAFIPGSFVEGFDAFLGRLRSSLLAVNTQLLWSLFSCLVFPLSIQRLDTCRNKEKNCFSPHPVFP